MVDNECTACEAGKRELASHMRSRSRSPHHAGPRGRVRAWAWAWAWAWRGAGQPAVALRKLLVNHGSELTLAVTSDSWHQ
jgi:hypothetical protein